MRRIALFGAFALCAFTQPPDRDASPLVECYYAQALATGTRKCDPPALLVSTVYGACAALEDGVRDRIYGDDTIADKPEVARIAIETIHRRMSPRIAGWILDTQTSTCPRS